MPIYLKNPHSVLAVLETRPQDIIEIRLPPGDPGGAWQRVQSMAQNMGIRIVPPEEIQRDRKARRHKPEPGRRGGSTEAVVKECPETPLDELFAATGETGLWLALDTVQDPQNLGAIFRTAAFFGIRGILLTKDRSAPMSSTAYDVASGGVEYVPFFIQTNLSRALDIAKESGLWVLGASEHADTSLDQIQPDRRWLLVLGNEERGLRRLTLEKCDTVCQIAPAGKITSLNVSVAAGILIQKLSAGPG